MTEFFREYLKFIIPYFPICFILANAFAWTSTFRKLRNGGFDG